MNIRINDAILHSFSNIKVEFFGVYLDAEKDHNDISFKPAQAALFMETPKYNKALQKIQAVESKWESKINSLESNLQMYKAECDKLKDDIDIKSGKKIKLFSSAMTLSDKPSEPGSSATYEEVNKYNEEIGKWNNLLDLVRRLEDQYGRAVDKYNDTLEKKNSALADAQVEIESLQQESELVINEDYEYNLAKLEKSFSSLQANSNNPLEIISAALIIRNFCEIIGNSSISSNTTRAIKDLLSKVQIINEIEKLKEIVQDLSTEMLMAYVLNKNILSEATDIETKVDLNQIATISNELDSLLATQLNFTYEYKSIIDPTELSIPEKKMQDSKAKAIEVCKNIDEILEKNNAAITDNSEKGQSISEKFKQMKENRNVFSNDLVYWLLESNNERLVEKFYNKDETKAIDFIFHKLELENKMSFSDVLALINENDFFVKECNTSLADTLNSLEGRRKDLIQKENSYKESIKKLEEDLIQITDVPKQQANNYLQEFSKNKGLLNIPLLNLFGLSKIIKTIETYAVGVKSKNSFFVDSDTKIKENLNQGIKVNKITLISLGILTLVSGILFFLLQMKPIAFGSGILFILTVNQLAAFLKMKNTSVGIVKSFNSVYYLVASGLAAVLLSGIFFIENKTEIISNSNVDSKKVNEPVRDEKATLIETKQNTPIEEKKPQETTKPIEQKTPEPTPMYVASGIIDTKAGLRLRSGAGANYPKIDFLYYQTKFKILDLNGPEETIDGVQGKWMKIEHNKKTGWIFGGFVKLE